VHFVDYITQLYHNARYKTQNYSELINAVTKPTQAHKCTRVFYIINAVCFLHISASVQRC